MARNIAANQDRVYRAVIRARRRVMGVLQDEIHTDIEGVYNKPGAAKARVSFWRGYLGEGFVNGWVEESDPITWHHLAEGTPVAKGDQAAKG